jgi:hypothetical protein
MGSTGLAIEMRIDVSPYYLTYYMLDWTKVKQFKSRVDCISCGGRMNRVEPARDKKGLEYEGTVCHKCKTVLWVKR